VKTAEILKCLAVVAALCLFPGLPQQASAQGRVYFTHADLEMAAAGILDKTSPGPGPVGVLAPTAIGAYSASVSNRARSSGVDLEYDPCAGSQVGQHTLTITWGEGGVVSTQVISGTFLTTLTGAGTFALDDGVQVTATAVADTGWRFTGWTGTTSCDENPFAFTLTSDQSMEAHFMQDPLTLTVTCGQGGKVTKPGIGPFSYQPGTTIPVEAVANRGYGFARWAGTVIDKREIADPSLSETHVVLNEGGTLYATFEAIRSFHESWETAAAGTYVPTNTTFIHADEGAWSLEDAITDVPSCGSTPQRAGIVKLDGGQALLLTSADSQSTCSDITSICLTEAGLVNPGFALTIDANTVLSFYEVGWLDHPELHNPTRDCRVPPCFDNVSLVLSDNKGNVLAYVLQRYPDATANVPNAHFGGTYREIFLDPSGIYYRRNLLSDLQTIPAFDPKDATIRSIEFRADEHGSAILDDVTIEPGSVDGRVPVYRFWSPTLECHFFTTSADEKQNLIDLHPNTWTFEGIAYFAPADDRTPGALPVYRFWSCSLSTHFYTISEAEKDMLVRDYPDVWTLDGIAFYAYPEGHQPADACPVYRFWSGVLGSHFYTTSEKERDNLVANFASVWMLEGVAWYAYPPQWDSGKALAIVCDSHTPDTRK
jgi:hypothetical protein